MTIFRNNLKRIFRSKVQLIFILLFPLGFMSLSFITDEVRIRVSIIDLDQTQLTKDLREELASKAKMIDPIEESMIEEKLKKLKVDYVLKIDKGFTDAIISGEEMKLHSYSVKESNISIPTQAFIQQWIGDARSIAAAVDHNPERFYTEFEHFNQSGILKMEKKSLVDEGRGKPRTALGYMVMAMLYTSLISALVILMNKNNHTLYRTLIAPVRMRSYMLQIILSFLVVSLIQILFVLLVIQLGFDLFAGATIYSIFLLLVIFSLVSVSLGMMISAFSKNIIQAVFFGICTIPPLSMLGGAYFPLDYASDTVKTLSHLSPVHWVMSGVEKIVRGQDLSTVIGDIMIMLLFAVVFFLLGIIRKVDVAK